MTGRRKVNGRREVTGGEEVTRRREQVTGRREEVTGRREEVTGREEVTRERVRIDERQEDRNESSAVIEMMHNTCGCRKGTNSRPCSLQFTADQMSGRHA